MDYMNIALNAGPLLDSIIEYFKALGLLLGLMVVVKIGSKINKRGW